MGDLLRRVLLDRRVQIQGKDSEDSEDEDESDEDNDEDFGPVREVPQLKPPPGIFLEFEDKYKDYSFGGNKKTSAKDVILLLEKDEMICKMLKPEQIEQLKGTMCLQMLSNLSKEDLDIKVTVFKGNTLNFHVGFLQGYMDINVICKKAEKEEDGLVVTEIHRHRTEVVSRDNAAPNFTLPLVVEQVISAAKMKPPVPVTSDSIRDKDSGAFGYNVWPKMGFNAVIPSKLITKMIAFCDSEPYYKFLQNSQDTAKKFLITNAETLELADMFLTAGLLYDQLCCIWRECGDTISTEFDTSSLDSKSFQLLKKYTQMKKLKPEIKTKNDDEESISEE